MQSKIKTRRRPQQSRAWTTSQAIQDAFVILLVEKGFDQVSMRNIANLAGVGLGTLYLYFPSKESIAAVAVRTWTRRMEAAIRQRFEREDRHTLQTVTAIAAIAEAMIETTLENPECWRAMMIMERRISANQPYREMYMHYVGLFREVLCACIDWPTGADAQVLAFNTFTIINSMIKDSMLVLPTSPQAESLGGAVKLAAQAYLHAAITQQTGHTGSAAIAPSAHTH